MKTISVFFLERGCEITPVVADPMKITPTKADIIEAILETLKEEFRGRLRDILLCLRVP